MKSILFKAAFVAVFVFVAGYGVYSSQQEESISDWAMANVEALANGEVWGNSNAGTCTGTFLYVNLIMINGGRMHKGTAAL